MAEDTVDSIPKSARRELFRRMTKYRIVVACVIALWLIFIFGMVPGGTLIDRVLFFAVVPIAGTLGWYAYIAQDIRKLFWSQFARTNHLVYQGTKDIAGERALFFQTGDNRKTYNCVRGTYKGLPLSLFEYHYTTGSGKNKRTHLFTVCEVRFAGSFPHLYLNFRNDGIPRSGGFFLPQISLPSEFEKSFTLYAPNEYEIEALEIFTPDTLTHLLDTGWKYDLELVESELLIFKSGIHHTRGGLEAEFQSMWRFVEHLSPRLNRMKLEKIGDKSPLL